jgi:outer membrane receptor protein involved in Fe transport
MHSNPGRTELPRTCLAATLTLAAALAGCASADSNQASASREPHVKSHDLEATTGSNMRRRTPLATSGGDVQTINRDELEREAGRIGQNPPRN